MNIFCFHHDFSQPGSRATHKTVIGDIRLDNRAELLNKLKPNVEVSTSNENIVLLLYRKYGINCLDYIIGAFSFVIYDQEKQTIYCCRDQIGVSPLYYYFDNQKLIISNRKNEILKFDRVDKSPNWGFIIQKITNQIRLPNESEYRHVHRVLPANYVDFDGTRQPKQKKYWSYDTTTTIQYKSNSEYIEHFQSLIETAVASRMLENENIGCHLSGGLDSSGIVGVASYLQRQRDKNVTTFSYVLPEDIDTTGFKLENENPFVRDQIKFSSIKDYHLIDKPLKFTAADTVENEALHLDGFSATNNLATEYEIQTLAERDNINVLLSGFPGDEVVTSFVRPYYLEYLEKGQFIKYFTSKHNGKYKFSNLSYPFLLKILQTLPILNINMDTMAKKYSSRHGISKKSFELFKKVNLFSNTYIKENDHLRDNFKIFSNSLYPFGFPLSLKEYQANHIGRLQTSARIESENLSAHRFGINYRYPFADLRLTQFVISLPLDQKKQGDLSRYIYRKSMVKYTPKSILTRDNKAGSIKPMAAFYRKDTGSLKDLYYKLLEGNHLPFMDHPRTENYINKNKIPPIFSSFLLLGCLSQQQKIAF